MCLCGWGMRRRWTCAPCSSTVLILHPTNWKGWDTSIRRHAPRCGTTWLWQPLTRRHPKPNAEDGESRAARARALCGRLVGGATLGRASAPACTDEQPNPLPPSPALSLSTPPPKLPSSVESAGTSGAPPCAAPPAERMTNPDSMHRSASTNGPSADSTNRPSADSANRPSAGSKNRPSGRWSEATDGVLAGSESGKKPSGGVRTGGGLSPGSFSPSRGGVSVWAVGEVIIKPPVS